MPNALSDSRLEYYMHESTDKEFKNYFAVSRDIFDDIFNILEPHL